ncbi:unnamed protein product [Ectocarpus sp. 12 AP-2014]
MRIQIIFLFLLSFKLIPTTMAQTQIQKDKLEITQVSKARAKAFNQMNAVEIAKYFALDGILMAPGKEVCVGQKAVAEYYQTIFDEFDVVLKSYYEEVEVSGDLAYGRGEAEVRATSKIDGIESIARSKYLNILKRQADGSWKTTHDIWNGNSVTIE